jgi:hypothetical protein
MVCRAIAITPFSRCAVRYSVAFSASIFGHRVVSLNLSVRTYSYSPPLFGRLGAGEKSNIAAAGKSPFSPAVEPGIVRRRNHRRVDRSFCVPTIRSLVSNFLQGRGVQDVARSSDLAQRPLRAR